MYLTFSIVLPSLAFFPVSCGKQFICLVAISTGEYSKSESCNLFGKPCAELYMEGKIFPDYVFLGTASFLCCIVHASPKCKYGYNLLKSFICQMHMKFQYSFITDPKDKRLHVYGYIKQIMSKFYVLFRCLHVFEVCVFKSHQDSCYVQVYLKSFIILHLLAPGP